MNLMDLFVKIGVDDQASSKVSRITDSIGNGLKTAAKIGTAAVSLVSTGVVALTKMSIEQFAQYEQLAGGVEKLFAVNSNRVKQYANKAYKEAGMSANEYLETVTGFSASLISGLGGDTKKAAEIANIAIKDMADNANTFGTDIESIKTTYAAFAKQNFTLLDNLKLGYGGTQAEMARLINDSGVLGDAIEVTAESVKDVPFDKIILAINKIQKNLKITGTTAKESSKTIAGSWSSTKAAWKNLLTGMADDTQDFEVLVGNVVESTSSLAENVVPRVEKAFNGVVKFIEGFAPIVADALPTVVTETLPRLVNSAADILDTLLTAIVDNADKIATGALAIVGTLLNVIFEQAPKILDAGLEMLITLVEGLASNADKVVPKVIEVILKMVDILTNPETLRRLLEASMILIVAIGQGLIEALPQLLIELPQIITTMYDFMLNDGVPMMIDAGMQLIESLFANMPQILMGVLAAVGEIVGGIGSAFMEYYPRMIDIGGDIVNGIWEGIKKAGSTLFDSIKGFFGDVGQAIMDVFDINSPSRWARDEVGAMIIDGVGEGFEEEGENVERRMGSELEKIKNGLDTDIEADFRYNFDRNSAFANAYGTYEGNPTGVRGGAENEKLSIGEQTFRIYIGEDRLTDIIVDIMRKEVRTT